MPITSQVRHCLLENGYKNFCLLSYGHTGETDMTEFADDSRPQDRPAWGGGLEAVR